MQKGEQDSWIMKLAFIELLIQEKTAPESPNVSSRMYSTNSRIKAKENDNPEDIDDKLKAINDIANQSTIISLPQLDS